MSKILSSLFSFVAIVILSHSQLSAQVFPKASWENHPAPAFSGWNPYKLNELFEYARDSTLITGMVLVHKGQVVMAYGDVKDNHYIASCRKSVLAMLYGQHVAAGTIDLQQKLKDIDFLEKERLTKGELQATVEDLIQARSGIFLTGSNRGDMRDQAPERGAVKPGEFWLYSNWDFNMAGHLFEVLTGKNIYDEIDRQFAKPLGMEDWDRSLQEKSGNPLISEIMAYHMWFSTRDMARLGLLMLNDGMWDGKRVLPEGWVEAMTKAYSSVAEVDKVAPIFKESGADYAYGYMWWLWKNQGEPGLKGAYSANGAWGQNLTVFPEIDAVLAIKTNSAYQRPSGSQKGIHDLVKLAASAYNPEAAQDMHTLSAPLLRHDYAAFGKAYKRYQKANSEAQLEPFLNQMAYGLLNTGQEAEALQIFKMITEVYPKSWNAFDSLGEAYFMQKNWKMAKANYERSVKLNSDNENGNNDRIKDILEMIKLK